MDEIISKLKEIAGILNWPVTTLIILFMVRKHLGLVFTGLQSLLNRTTKLVIDGKTVTLEAAAEIIKEQKQIINEEQKQKNEIKKELADFENGGVQALPMNVFSNNRENLEPFMKTNRMESIIETKKKKSDSYPDDPEKGKWGGKSISNDKRITASVIPMANLPFLFKIKLLVTSTNPASQLQGKVTFHLHPTFINSVRTVEAEKGTAQLNLIAYGAFTVGVQTEDGTKLELDLAEDMSLPERFRNN